jgi:hypothetical protein
MTSGSRGGLTTPLQRPDPHHPGMREPDERPIEQRDTDDLTPEVPANTPAAAGAAPGTGTGLQAEGESDPYALEVQGPGNVIQSDLVGAAELSSEYTAGHAADDTGTNADEARDAFREAAADSLADDEAAPGR